MYMDLNDIMREHALQYLPAKSLSRFRSVCREWRYQISSPFFAHKQSLSFRSISGLLCQSAGDKPKFISINPRSCGVPDPSLSFIPEPVEIMSSSNGLLCCHSRADSGTYYICNPATQQWKKLPKPTANHGLVPSVVLVFEPSLLNFTADYKLVCLFLSSEFDDALELEIYSSVEGSWKMSRDISFSSKRVVPRSGIHVNNVVYWKLQQSGVLAFDLVKDRLLTYGYYTYGTLGGVNGKLCSASMNGYTLRVEVPDMYSDTMSMYGHANLYEKCVPLDSKVVGIHGPVEVVIIADYTVIMKCGRKYCLVDLKTMEIKLLTDNPSCHVEWCVPYVNSLVGI